MTGDQRVIRNSSPRRPLASSHKMDDFETIPVVEMGLRPAFPADNLAVQFHRHAVLFQVERMDQVLEAGLGRNVAQLPVDYNFHPLPVV